MLYPETPTLVPLLPSVFHHPYLLLAEYFFHNICSQKPSPTPLESGLSKSARETPLLRSLYHLLQQAKVTMGIRTFY
jgi:hypothetical protein